MIKAIIFDFDDTLYSYNLLDKLGIEKICGFVCKKLQIDEDKFYSAFNKAKRSVKEQLGNVASSHNRLLYCQKTMENLNENPFSIALEMYDIYWNYVLENMKLNENALELLKFCKKEKIKIGICTDLTVHIQHRKIRKLKIDEYIDAIVTSEEVGAEKPNFKMYDKILKKLNILSEEAIFIGDSLKKDVEGSFKYGMKALWYSTEKSERYETVQNFGQILEKLKNERSK